MSNLLKFKWFPILGQLNEATSQDFQEAFKEFFLTLLVALSPLWCTAIFVFIVKSLGSETNILFFSHLYQLVIHGELFIYSATILAPVLYIIIRDQGKNPRKFPSKVTYLSAVIIVALISTLFLSVQYSQHESFNSSIIKWSLAMFIVSLVIYYTSLVFNNSMIPDAPALMKKQEEDFTTQFEKHRS